MMEHTLYSTALPFFAPSTRSRGRLMYVSEMLVSAEAFCWFLTLVSHTCLLGKNPRVMGRWMFDCWKEVLLRGLSYAHVGACLRGEATAVAGILFYLSLCLQVHWWER